MGIQRFFLRLTLPAPTEELIYMLVVTGVRKGYEVPQGRVDVLAGVDLKVDPGEFVCLYGASGSGKTTLLNLVAGLETPDAGSVYIEDQEISAASESVRARMRLESVGVVFQRDNLLTELSVWENVALPLLGRGMARSEARATAFQALEQVAIRHLAERLPDQLSGGERQRVGIARGLIGNRKVLVADEPTGSLDSENSRALFGLLSDLARSTGTAIIVATHDPLAMPLASRCVTMLDGRVSAE